MKNEQIFSIRANVTLCVFFSLSGGFVSVVNSNANVHGIKFDG